MYITYTFSILFTLNHEVSACELILLSNYSNYGEMLKSFVILTGNSSLHSIMFPSLVCHHSSKCFYVQRLSTTWLEIIYDKMVVCFPNLVAYLMNQSTYLGQWQISIPAANIDCSDNMQFNKIVYTCLKDCRTWMVYSLIECLW